jgi:ABC-type transport system substrate-binding protein
MGEGWLGDGLIEAPVPVARQDTRSGRGTQALRDAILTLRPVGFVRRREALANLAGGILASEPARAQAPTRGDTLMVGLSNDAKTYDPIFSVRFTERYVLYLAFDTLVRYEPDFAVRPELAESWETSPDGKRIVFPPRRGVTFQDGTPFDATAVKWNIDQRMDGGGTMRI